MNIIRLTGIVILITTFTIGCSGANGKLKTLPESDSKITKQILIDNWTEYKISVNYNVSRTLRIKLIVFEPKSDHRKILFGYNWKHIFK